MERPKLKSDRGVFNGLKSKLGFADAQDQNVDDGYYDDGYADDYDEYGDDYEEFAEYGPDYDTSYTGTRYDAPDAVTTRSPRASSRASRTDGGFPRLVSIDDVRAHTRVPDSLNRDPLPARHVTSAQSSSARRADRTIVDATAPAPSSPAYVAAAAKRETEQSRSEGLDSLFSSTTPEGSVGSSSELRRLPLRAPRSIRTRRTRVRALLLTLRRVRVRCLCPTPMATWSAWPRY